MEEVFHLTDEENLERLPSGRQRTIYNRVSWAITHIRKAGLLEFCEKRGSFRITAAGKHLLEENPHEINMKVLRRYDSYRDFAPGIQAPISVDTMAEAEENTGKTPEEILGVLSEQLNLQLAKDILDEIFNRDSDFFEGLVVDLLLKMGYGGLEGSGEVTKKTGDGGIDGIIKQDELGLDMIYIQAKKWDRVSTVSRPDIQKFAGALLGEGATKGVFITTANFTKGAMDYAKSVPNTKIILIDGLTLAKFMIKHDLGVSTSNTIRVKKIDSDYFEEQ